MSSCVRIARSPIAWTIRCRPAASAPFVQRYRSSIVFTNRPRSCGASVNGSSIAAVCEPSEPSTNPFERADAKPLVAATVRRDAVAETLPRVDRNGGVDARREAARARARARTRRGRPTCPCDAPTSHPARRRSASRRRAPRRAPASLGGGATRSTSDCALSLRTPVGSPLASRTIVPPSTSGVSRVMPAARSAALFASAMCPSSRLTHTGCCRRVARRSTRAAAARRPRARGPNRRSGSTFPPVAPRANSRDAPRELRRRRRVSKLHRRQARDRRRENECASR